jgi:hypothetical protein
VIVGHHALVFPFLLRESGSHELPAQGYLKSFFFWLCLLQSGKLQGRVESKHLHSAEREQGSELAPFPLSQVVKIWGKGVKNGEHGNLKEAGKLKFSLALKSRCCS